MARDRRESRRPDAGHRRGPDSGGIRGLRRLGRAGPGSPRWSGRGSRRAGTGPAGSSTTTTTSSRRARSGATSMSPPRRSRGRGSSTASGCRTASRRTPSRFGCTSTVRRLRASTPTPIRFWSGTFSYFTAPLVTTFAGGQVCYEPIVFRDSLRIDTENRAGLQHYYQYSYRTFPPGTDLVSWNGTLDAGGGGRPPRDHRDVPERRASPGGGERLGGAERGRTDVGSGRRHVDAGRSGRPRSDPPPERSHGRRHGRPARQSAAARVLGRGCPAVDRRAGGLVLRGGRQSGALP